MLSQHFINDRADRYAFIATTVGVGNVIHTHKQKYSTIKGAEPCTVKVTDTGVAIVVSASGAIVTMYLMTIHEAEKYFTLEGMVIPFVLAAIIKKNMKRRLHILQNEVKY